MYCDSNLPSWFSKKLLERYSQIILKELSFDGSIESPIFAHLETILHLKPQISNFPKLILFTDSEIDAHLEAISDLGYPHIFHISEQDDLSILFHRLQYLLHTLDDTEKYKPSLLHTPHSKSLKSPMEIEEISHQIVSSLKDFNHASKIRMVLVETLTNAFFYGARDEDPSAKFNWNVDFELSPPEQIQVRWGLKEDQLAICVKDFGGKLNSHTLLHWLNRQTTSGDSGLPLGIYDTHGRGLFISRKLMDYFFINVIPGTSSECIMITHKNPKGNSNCKDISFLTK